MARAVTNLKIGRREQKEDKSRTVEAGSEVNRSDFTDDEWRSLVEAGAVTESNEDPKPTHLLPFSEQIYTPPPHSEADATSKPAEVKTEETPADQQEAASKRAARR